MKKLIILITVLLFSGILSAQNTFKYGIVAPSVTLPSGDVQTQLDNKLDKTSGVEANWATIEQADSIAAPKARKTYVDSIANPILRTLKAYPGFVGDLLPDFATLSASTSPTALTSGVIWGINFTVFDTTTYTGVKFNLQVAANGTPTNVNGVSIYVDNAGTLTKLSGAEITGATFWTTVGLNTRAFSSPAVFSPGKYKLCFMFSGPATVPSIWNWGTVLSGGGISAVLGNSEMPSQSATGYIAFPTGTFTAANLGTTQPNLPMFWLYK